MQQLQGRFVIGLIVKLECLIDVGRSGKQSCRACQTQHQCSIQHRHPNVENQYNETPIGLDEARMGEVS
jgi:hypothetical protein